MNHKLVRAYLTAFLTSVFLISYSLAATGADSKVVVRMKHLSVNTLKVDATKSGAIFKLVGFVSSSTNLKASDFECSDSVSSPNSDSIAIESLGNNDYRITCNLTVGKTDMRGLYEAGLGLLDDENHSNWQMVPMNARYLIPNTFVDSFGIKRTEEILGFTFQRNAKGFATPIAISPPSDYKVPSFTSGTDGYLIFDSASTSSKPVVKFSKDKKNFSLTCPAPSTKVSSSVKKQAFVAFWINKALYKPGSILGSTFEPSNYNNLVLPKSLKGKNVKIACSTEFRYPDTNVILAYSESAEISVRFPS